MPGMLCSDYESYLAFENTLQHKCELVSTVQCHTRDSSMSHVLQFVDVDHTGHSELLVTVSRHTVHYHSQSYDN